ncbi:insulinase family protein [candidate division GN15 bacterium]|uniref:Insulinase family protein n=1 Tax=candidate division GN15 bacterium TaxID=2072418 RepID=A0A855X3V8_9BACT|nr:MAG: insulinase family protein [candidate division GN15 bacterium]
MVRKKLLAIAAAVTAVILSATQLSAAGIQLDVKKHVLANGMRILVLENHSAPVFSTVVRFNVGAVDERPGITGTSHLLEHMRFKGSKVIGTTNYDAEVPILAQIDSVAHLMKAEQVRLQSPLNSQDSTLYKQYRQQIADLQAQEKKYIIKDEIWRIYLQNGAAGFNASTGNDGTQYIVSLPSNRLELWAFMESDRLQNLVLREFYSERDVVMEERRMSYENSPRGALGEAAAAATYWSTPYNWPVVGWMSDLQNVQREDVEQYYKEHYSVSNAVAVIVGDVKADEVFALCEKYFGPIAAEPLPRPVVTRDARQRGERRIDVEFDASPMGSILWHTPQIGHPDIPALDVASSILSDGRTSRFFKNIRQTRIGQASAGVDAFNRYPGTFNVDIQPFGDHTLQEVEDSVYAEIERMKTTKVSQWEIDKVINQGDAALVRSLDNNMGLAYRLANSETLTGNWRYFVDYQDALKKVTPDDVMRVCNTYLTRENRTVVSLVKPYAQETAQTPGKAN